MKTLIAKLVVVTIGRTALHHRRYLFNVRAIGELRSA